MRAAFFVTCYSRVISLQLKLSFAGQLKLFRQTARAGPPSANGFS